MKKIYTTILFFAISHFILAQNSHHSPIHVELAQPGFATFTNEAHPGNRIGYRFHEHQPITFGHIPSSNQQAGIDLDMISGLESVLHSREGVFVYNQSIESDENWVRQDWIFYLWPVEDGIEIDMVVQTYDKGLPEYYGIQQCFRMSGNTNAEWRKKIANTPAFSEYDLWKKDSLEKRSLTYIFRSNKWEALPAVNETVGARTPYGMKIDSLRTGGNLMSEVGPYKAKMQGGPVDVGLITRTDIAGNWNCGIYWEGTSHVTNHHPADCLHSIVNIGYVPPFSKKTIRGKIYWFKGTKADLSVHFNRDFNTSQKNVPGWSKNESQIENSGKKYNIYFGDLHNHNSVGYAKGSLERSFEIARSHLDFYALTPHSQWHDMPLMEGDRHMHWVNGFKRTEEQWADVQEITAAYNDPGSFVTFPAYEWHSSYYGDYCLYSPVDDLPLEIFPELKQLQEYAKEKGMLIIPHHPGYLQGHRGANFSHMDTEVSPVLEIYSEHGNAESLEGPFPYIRHSMGGRWTKNTYQDALSSGLRIGAIASTDDHLGYPGAYGEGLVAVLAEDLSRKSIFEALRKRRTYAVSGDRIRLDFRLNGQIMGEEVPFSDRREISVSASGWDKIDRMELLKNNLVIKRHFPVDERMTPSSWEDPVLLRIEMGWGPWSDLDLTRICDWDMAIRIADGILVDVYPCFQSGPFSETKRNLITERTADRCTVKSYTSRKQAFAENPTNAVVLRIKGSPETGIEINLKKPAEMKVSKSLHDLIEDNAVFFTGAFPAESFILHPVVFSDNYSGSFEFTEIAESQKDADWYYIRVIQSNGQMAWSSPIWVEGK